MQSLEPLRGRTHLAGALRPDAAVSVTQGPALAGLPELDEPGWTSDDFIRDFPVDFSLVLENVADPDHGIFAHQTPIFDSFAASAEYPMQVSTEPGRGGPKVRPHLHSLMSGRSRGPCNISSCMRSSCL